MARRNYGVSPTNAKDLTDKQYVDGLSGGGGLAGAVQSTAPASPTTNYLWVDTSEPGVTEHALFGTANPTTPASGSAKTWIRTVAGRSLIAAMGPAGLDHSAQPLIARDNIRYALATANSNTPNVLGTAITATGTATAATVTGATTSTAAALHLGMKRIDYLVTTAATTAVAGFREANNSVYVSSAAGMGGFFFVCRFSPATGAAAGTARRTFCGLTNSTAAPTDVDPSTLTTNTIGVGYSSADTNWQIYTAGTAGTKVNTTLAKPASGTDRPGMWEIALFAAPGSLVINYEFTDLFTNTKFTGATTAGTNSPANGTTLSARGWHSVGGTSSVVGFTLVSMYLETDF